MRNPNGTGSISKLSGKRRKKYMVRSPKKLVFDEKTETYKYISEIIGYAKNKLEAYDILNKYNSNPLYYLSKTKFKVFWNEYTEHKFINASPQVITYHKTAYKFSEDIHNIDMIKITNDTLQNLINNSDYSENTLKSIKTAWIQMWDYALLKDVVNKNVVKYVTIPNKGKVVEKNALTEEQVSMLWNNLDDITEVALIYIYTGLRRDELMNIKIKDIFLDQDYMVGGSKTKAGKNRIIPIHKRIKPFILKHYNENNKYLINNIGANKIISRTNCTIINFIFNKDSLINFSTHELRYTFASLMDKYCPNGTITDKIIGHSSGNLRKDLYTQKEIKDLIDAIHLIP